MMTRKIRNQIDGVLLLDKPLGISSNQAINKVKYAFNASKVGHTGTLDPMATGLLPVCLGEATKFASYLLDGNKEYIATMQLGVVTDSGDAEGNIVATNLVAVTRELIDSAFREFKGEITQIPPMYSALKYNGKPLYEYARAGIEIERKSRQVTIYELELIDYDSVLEQITFRTLVSKGTYIRTLAEDIGNYLQCGASLLALRRTKTNSFKIEDTISLAQLVSDANTLVDGQILSVDVLVNHLPSCQIDDLQIGLVQNGNICRFPSGEFIDGQEYRLYYVNKFMGIGIICQEEGYWWLKPKRMLRVSVL